jgi:hypothetical protein
MGSERSGLGQREEPGGSPRCREGFTKNNGEASSSFEYVVDRHYNEILQSMGQPMYKRLWASQRDIDFGLPYFLVC